MNQSENGDPTNSNWGRWGADDERGTLNLLGPETVAAAAQLCKTGRVFPLGIPFPGAGAPVAPHRTSPARLNIMDPSDRGTWTAFGATPEFGAFEDLLIIPTHSFTHLDALSHVHDGGLLFNGHPTESISGLSGASRCGIEKTGPIVARAVVLDLPGIRGKRWLEPGEPVDVQALDDALSAADVDIRPGDAVLVRTGFLEWWRSSRGPTQRQPGLTVGAAEMLAQLDVALIGADNAAIEVLPAPDGSFLPLHKTCLLRYGIHLLEFLELDDLAAAGVTECMLVVAPLPITGASGSPVNPIAIA